MSSISQHIGNVTHHLQKELYRVDERLQVKFDKEVKLAASLRYRKLKQCVLQHAQQSSIASCYESTKQLALQVDFQNHGLQLEQCVDTHVTSVVKRPQLDTLYQGNIDGCVKKYEKAIIDQVNRELNRVFALE